MLKLNTAVLLDRLKQQKEQKPPEGQEVAGSLSHDTQESTKVINVDLPKLVTDGFPFTEKQIEFIQRVLDGQDVVLFGAAGTGKTTSLKGVVRNLIHFNKLTTLQDVKHKYLLPNTPGIVVTSYMNRSVWNDKKVLTEYGLEHNCITLHKLLEYQPDFYELTNPETGKSYTKMEFRPNRHLLNKLDSNIRIIVIDEAGNTPVELYQQLIDALPRPEEVQFIFMGDLYQIPPVFGAAILGHKGAELKDSRIVLTDVKRQDADSPILALATHIRKGNIIQGKELKNWNMPGLEIRPWKLPCNEIIAMNAMRNLFTDLYKKGEYMPEKDIIIMLQNVKFGGDELNKHIAQLITLHKQREVWEVIAGFIKSYYAVGEYVLYNKEDFIVKDIKINPIYEGMIAQLPSKTLDYWGVNPDIHYDAEAALSMTIKEDDQTAEERKRAASHIITLQSRIDKERELTIKSAGEINKLALGYVCTVHKALGAEWEKVFLLIHKSNASMTYREILYTAITRAQKELVIVCENDTFVKGVQNQKIAGESIDEKLEYFQDRPLQIPRFKK